MRERGDEEGKGRSWFVLTRNRPARVLSRSLSHVSSSLFFSFNLLVVCCY